MRTSNRSRVFLLLCVVLLLVPVAASAGPGATQERPIEVVWSGAFEMVHGAAWCEGLDGYAGVTMPITGHGSHLGAVTGWGQHCSHPDGDMTRGVGVFVAANGDEVHLTYSGFIIPVSETEVQIISTQLIDGGTGRFTNATGELDSVCLAEFTSPLGGVIIESRDVGVITYDASDRSRR